MPSKGAYVLIHGGGTTSRFWDRLLPYLDRPYLAVDLPGRPGKPADLGAVTVDDEVASVVADINGSGLAGPYVLVAHSSGGLLVPGAVAALARQVEQVVLNAATVPPEGGCGLDCMQPRFRERVAAAAEHSRTSGRPFVTGEPSTDPESYRKAYGGPPLSDEDAAFVADPVRNVIDTMNHYFQPVSWRAASDVPVTYVLNTLDRPVPPDLQRGMIGHLPGRPTVIELDSGHIPAIVQPRELARAIEAVTERI